MIWRVCVENLRQMHHSRFHIVMVARGPEDASEEKENYFIDCSNRCRGISKPQYSDVLTGQE